MTRCHGEFDLPCFWYPRVKFPSDVGIPEFISLGEYGIPQFHFISQPWRICHLE